MPAATADTLTLPRVDVAAEARPRRVAAVTTAPAGHEGEGFPVRRAFAAPDVPAHEGWEPLAATRDRVVAVVHGLLDAHPGEDLVLVGHGTAWTLVAAELTGGPPDLERWSRLGMPDVISIG